MTFTSFKVDSFYGEPVINFQKSLNSLFFVHFVIFCKKLGQEKLFSKKKSFSLQSKQTTFYSRLFSLETSRSFSHFLKFIIFNLDIKKKKTQWRIYKLSDAGSIKEHLNKKGHLTDLLCDGIAVLETLTMP